MRYPSLNWAKMTTIASHTHTTALVSNYAGVVLGRKERHTTSMYWSYHKGVECRYGMVDMYINALQLAHKDKQLGAVIGPRLIMLTPEHAEIARSI